MTSSEKVNERYSDLSPLETIAAAPRELRDVLD
jgi:hypothetical protein